MPGAHRTATFLLPPQLRCSTRETSLNVATRNRADPFLSAASSLGKIPEAVGDFSHRIKIMTRPWLESKSGELIGRDPRELSVAELTSGTTTNSRSCKRSAIAVSTVASTAR